MHSQVLQRTELQLFDGSFAAAQFGGNFAQAFLLHEAVHDDQALIRRQFVDQLIEHGPLFGLRIDPGIGCAGGSVPVVRAAEAVGKNRLLPGNATPTIREQVGSDAQQPRRKRKAAPLESRQIAQRLVKDLCRQIFCVVTVSHTPRDVGVHAGEIVFVKLGEAGWIPLRSRDQSLLVNSVLEDSEATLRRNALPG